MIQKILKAGISTAIIFTIAFEPLAQAQERTREPVEQKVRLNAASTPSEMVRAELHQFARMGVGNKDDKVYQQLRTLVENKFTALSGLNYPNFLDKNPELAWDAYIHIYYMIAYAKTGYVETSYLHRDRAIVALMDLIQATSKIPNGIRANYQTAMVEGIMQWAFATVGPVQAVEKKRVDFIMSDFHEVLFEKQNQDYIHGLYRSRNRTLEKTFNPIFFGGVASFLSTCIMSGILGDFSPAWLLTGPAWLSFVYFRLFYVESRSKVSYLMRAQIQKTMASYLQYDADFDQIRQVENSPYMPGEKSIPEESISAEDVSSLTIIKLKNLLSGKVTEEKNVLPFFVKVANDPNLAAATDKLIETDPELKAQALQGSQFKEAYEKQMAADFGKNQDAVIDPELQILKDLILQKKVRTTTQDVLITLKQAEDRAWEETKLHFGLPYNMELAEIETKKYDEDKYLSAYHYFRKRFYVLQQAETPQVLPTEINMEQFKASVRERIGQLRVANLKRALEFYKKTYPERQSLSFNTATGIQKVAIDSVLNAEIQIQEAGTYFQPIKVERAGDSVLVKNTWYGKRDQSKDENHARDFYKVERVFPVSMHRKLVLSAAQNITTLTEAELSSLLYELGPSRYSYNDQKMFQERYLTEAARRDAILADAADFIDDTHDKDAKELTVRLQRKIGARRLTQELLKTFSEELRDNPYVLEGRGLLNDIRWQGYSIHSDYWRTRDMDANKIARAIGFRQAQLEIKIRSRKDSLEKAHFVAKIFETVRPMPDLSADGHLLPETEAALKKKTIAEQEAIVDRRTVPYENRVKRGTILFSTALAIFLSLGVAASSVVTAGLKAVAQMLDFSSQSTGGDGPINVSDGKAHNHSASSEDNAIQKRTEFRLRVGDNAMMPTYLNIPLVRNIPSNSEQLEAAAIVDDDPQNEIEYDRKITTRTSKDQTPSAGFDLQTLSGIQSDGSFLPIPSPSGFRVYNIEVMSQYNGEPIPREDLRVFFDNRTGFSYLRVPDGLAGYTFNVEVSYQPIEQIHPYATTEWSVDSKSLQSVDAEIKGIDADKLGESLDTVTSESLTTDLKSLAYAFSTSAIYTYDKEGMDPILNWFSNNPFRYYKRFLRDGVLFYQCSGSNSLFTEYLNEYYKNNPNDVQAQSIVGYTIHGNIVSPIGHEHVIASHLSVPYSYVELDATPGTMDPKYANRKSDMEKMLEADQWKFKQKNKHRFPGEKTTDIGTLADLSSAPKVELTKDNKIPNAEGFEPKKEKKTILRPDPTLEDFDILVTKIHNEINKYKGYNKVHDMPALKALTFVPPMRNLMQSGTTDELIRQMVKVEFQLPQKENKSVSDFIMKQINELKRAHSHDSKAILHALIAQTKTKFESEVREEKLRPASAHSQMVLHDLTFNKLMSDYFDLFDRKFENLTTPVAPLQVQTCSAMFAHH